MAGLQLEGGGVEREHCRELQQPQYKMHYKTDRVLVSNLCMAAIQELFLLGLQSSIMRVLIFIYSPRCLWCGWPLSCSYLSAAKA